MAVQPKLPPPEILLEQGACLLINKPGGLLTQGPPGIDSLETRVKQFLKIRDAKPGKVYVGVPHRLDRPVSGVMVMVKNVRAAQRLSRQFRERTLCKTYWAVVEGELQQERGTWQDWMRKLPDQARSEIVSPDHPDAQKAILHFHVLAKWAGRTWLKINLETGRTHQIRLQASHHGHPILGDEMYGSNLPFGPATSDLRKRWIALHSQTLEFEHPISKETVSQSAPLPACWESLELPPIQETSVSPDS
ncbi:MAG: RNA pseudouridine synthase [Mariniblastus sp.]|nr:RNA pseudouridine synthase [Mariniblastus sp.]